MFKRPIDYAIGATCEIVGLALVGGGVVLLFFSKAGGLTLLAIGGFILVTGILYDLRARSGRYYRR